MSKPKITKSRLISLEIKAERNKRRFKAYTINQNRYHRRRAPKYKRNRTFFNKRKTIEVKEKLLVPSHFSITQKLETVLKFIYDCKNILRRNRINAIDFDFSQVIEVDDGAATMLLSVCFDMSAKGIRVYTNLPLDLKARNFINKSGFIQFFHGPHLKQKEDLLNITLKKGKAKIEQKDSAILIHKAMKTVFMNDTMIRNQRLQGMLIELMTNSVNHAYLNIHREKTWYLSTNHYIDENKVEFCFVDNGDGIINTINVKFREKYFTSNEDLLIKAFNGEFRSRTKLANRGRGLIAIRNGNEQMTIRGLKVITNNVVLDFESGVATKLRNSFSGTFYSWILDKTCK